MAEGWHHAENKEDRAAVDEQPRASPVFNMNKGMPAISKTVELLVVTCRKCTRLCFMAVKISGVHGAQPTHHTPNVTGYAKQGHCQQARYECNGHSPWSKTLSFMVG